MYHVTDIQMKEAIKIIEARLETLQPQLFDDAKTVKERERAVRLLKELKQKKPFYI